MAQFLRTKVSKPVELLDTRHLAGHHFVARRELAQRVYCLNSHHASVSNGRCFLVI